MQEYMALYYIGGTFMLMVAIGMWHTTSFLKERRHQKNRSQERDSDNLKRYQRLKAMKDLEFTLRQPPYIAPDYIAQESILCAIHTPAVDRLSQPVYTEQEGRKFRD